MESGGARKPRKFVELVNIISAPVLEIDGMCYHATWRAG